MSHLKDCPALTAELRPSHLTGTVQGGTYIEPQSLSMTVGSGPCQCDLIRTVLDNAVQRIEANRPLLDKTKHEGGYDCCGCGTYDDIFEDAIDAVKGES